MMPVFNYLKTDRADILSMTRDVGIQPKTVLRRHGETSRRFVVTLREIFSQGGILIK